MALSKRMTQLGCTVTVEQRDALGAVAKRLKVPATELVRRAIDDLLEKYDVVRTRSADGKRNVHELRKKRPPKEGPTKT